MPEKEFVFIINTDRERFTFDLDRTVRELLFNFLQRTNSIQTLDSKKIFFSYGQSLLNQTETLLNKCLKDVFPLRSSHIKIYVKDRAKIIGGIKNEE